MFKKKISFISGIGTKKNKFNECHDQSGSKDHKVKIDEVGASEKVEPRLDFL